MIIPEIDLLLLSLAKENQNDGLHAAYQLASIQRVVHSVMRHSEVSK